MGTRDNPLARRIRYLAARGTPQQAIAERLGVTRRRVRTVLEERRSDRPKVKRYEPSMEPTEVQIARARAKLDPGPLYDVEAL